MKLPYPKVVDPADPKPMWWPWTNGEKYFCAVPRCASNTMQGALAAAAWERTHDYGGGEVVMIWRDPVERWCSAAAILGVDTADLSAVPLRNTHTIPLSEYAQAFDTVRWFCLRRVNECCAYLGLDSQPKFLDGPSTLSSRTAAAALRTRLGASAHATRWTETYAADAALME